MTIETVLAGVTSLLSLGTLGVAVTLGVNYGRDKQILTTAVETIERTERKVETILGNGHPGPFVPREVHEHHIEANDREHREFGRRIGALEGQS